MNKGKANETFVTNVKNPLQGTLIDIFLLSVLIVLHSCFICSNVYMIVSSLSWNLIILFVQCAKLKKGNNGRSGN